MPIRRLMSMFGMESETPTGNPFAAVLGEHLKNFPSERLEYLAGFAGQLTRVAYADDEISEVESQTISTLLVEHAGLQEAEAKVVIGLLKSQLDELRGCEEYRLNRAVNDNASAEEKDNLISFLFAVAAADGVVSNVEDQEIRLVGNALNIATERFMNIRTRYRDKLEVIQAATAARLRSAADSDDS